MNYVRENFILFNLARRTFRFQIEVFKIEVLRTLWPPDNLGGRSDLRFVIYGPNYIR